MFVLFGRRAKVKRRKGGGQEVRRCPECEATCTFYEADEKEAFHVFFVELYSGDDIVWVCSECEEPMPWEATLEPALSPREQKRRDDRKRKELAKAKKAAQKTRAKREREVDDELAALKARLDRDG